MKNIKVQKAINLESGKHYVVKFDLRYVTKENATRLLESLVGEEIYVHGIMVTGDAENAVVVQTEDKESK